MSYIPETATDHEHYTTPKTVADSDERTGHLLAEMVDHQEQVPSVVHPGICEQGDVQSGDSTNNDLSRMNIQSILSLSSFRTPLTFIFAQSATHILRI